MELSPSLVRIVVLTGSPDSKEATDGGEAYRDTLDALAELGGEVEIELVHDAATALAAAMGGRIDLVLVDRADSVVSAPIFEALGDSGPPIVGVTAEAGESSALDAFRSGAADCVRVGPDYADVLPVVVLEQVRRWRKQRAKGVAERQIRDLQHYNENIIQNLNSALLVIDAEGRIVTANTTAEEVLAAESGGLVGRCVWDWLADETPEQSVIGRVLGEGLRFKGRETKLRLDDGSLLPIGISCSPLAVESDGEGELGGRAAVAIFQDLSEVKRLQRQVLQTEKMASIGQLAAGVAHEINNPMGFIHANLFQMTEYLGDLRQAWERVDDLQKAILNATGEAEGLDAVRAASESLAAVTQDLGLDFVQADFAKAVRESQDGAERIRHIVKDLRDFSHQGSDECSEADVNLCLDSTASIAWTMMKHSAVLEKEYCDLPPIRCYPSQLKQVFMNLLVNAYQAIEEKLGDSGMGRIELRSQREGDGVAISIRDTGTGIPARDQARIFDPFFTTKDVGAGTGLGLATSYNIVRRHGGRIDVTSEPGEGATFKVWLPLSGPEDA
ncbi:MAG: ATP-binding protein [Myxococcota bacterium]